VDLTDFRQPIQILANKTPAPLRRWMNFLFNRFMVHPSVQQDRRVTLAQSMVSGFSTAAAKKLEAIIVKGQPAEDVAMAALALGQWHRSHERHDRALDYLVRRRLATPRVRFDKAQLVLEADTLLNLGREREASAVIESGIAERGEIPELCFCTANAIALRPDLPQSQASRLRLEWISKPLVAAGFAPIEIRTWRGRLPSTTSPLRRRQTPAPARRRSAC
jgi:hypothetical protein